MATLDKVKLTLPGGKVFSATDNIDVTETHQPFWLFDGAQTLRTIAEQTPFVDNDTAQPYIGTGSRVRSWTVSFTQWEGSTDSWGNASSSDDVVVKLNELGQSLATAGVDGTNPITFEYGEYSSGGTHGAQNVVPGEVTLPATFGPDESATTARPQLQLLDAVDITNVLHSAP
jgi:hypothetical protein